MYKIDPKNTLRYCVITNGLSGSSFYVYKDALCMYVEYRPKTVNNKEYAKLERIAITDSNDGGAGEAAFLLQLLSEVPGV